MLTYTITRTGYRKHCVLTGPMAPILSVEFTNQKDAALFAQRDADGYRATLSIVNERGGFESLREIPPHPEAPIRKVEPTYLFPSGGADPAPPVRSPWLDRNVRMRG